MTQWDRTPVPCDQWTGECPHRDVLTCTQGCLTTQLPSVGNVDPQEICQENALMRLGKACTANAHCQPGGVLILFGDPPLTHLICDMVFNTCVMDPAYLPDASTVDADGDVADSQRDL